MHLCIYKTFHYNKRAIITKKLKINVNILQYLKLFRVMLDSDFANFARKYF